MEVMILRKNADQAASRFKELRQFIAEEEAQDNKKRQQYGNKWNRQPSKSINLAYNN